MLLNESTNSQLDDLLERICEKLQISQTQHKTAEDRYSAVADWLSKKESPLYTANPKIYPQGSLRIGTTVKPLNYQEYDLDLVCELNIDWQRTSPIKVLNDVESYLKQNEVYKQKVERKNRCVRLNYANEFHMDILPAAPDTQKNNGCVKIPDRKTFEWKDSNPKGYAEWFKKKSEQFFITLKMAEVQPLPEHESLENKTPLQRSVQLIKRYRDIVYKTNIEIAPISIVLTTLAGVHYQGQLSVANSISFILQGIIKSIKPNQRLIVLNPTNHDEDISERWDRNPDLYNEFVVWTNNFNKSWNEIRSMQGIQNILKILSKMFGENVTLEAIKEQAEFIEKTRKEGKLGVSAKTGLISITSSMSTIPIRKNTFYGE